MHRYSSLAAFLAHYQTLRKIPASEASPDDARRLAAMEQLLALLRSEERSAITEERAAIESDRGAIEPDSGASAVARHRERASIKLRRELLARGVIDG